jgi:S1-C subfamily serine protease
LPSPQGIAISGTQPGGLAANVRLQKGEIVLTVDGVTVENLAHFRRTYEDVVKKNQRLVLLTVKNGALTRYVVIKQDREAEPEAEPQPAETAPAEGDQTNVE